jgi:DNA-binding XRE family transcriptional regulator
MENTGIGLLIRKLQKERGMTVTALANKLGLSRDAVHSHFNSGDVHPSVLVKYCIILNYNFFQHYYNIVKEQKPELFINEPQDEYISEKDKEIKKLKQKIDMLVEANIMLLEKVRGME